MFKRIIGIIAFSGFVMATFGGCATNRLKVMQNDIDKLKQETSGLQKINTGISMKVEEMDSIIEQKNAAILNNTEAITEMKARLNNVEARMKPFEEKVLTAPKFTPSPSVVSTDNDQYSAAMDYLKRNEYDKAILEFQKLIKNFPDSDLADNAQYWIGECYYTQHQYLQAIEELKKVVRIYPMGNKAPDAMLKIGMSYAELQDYDRAIQELNLLIRKYPDSEVAHTAKAKVREISIY